MNVAVVLAGDEPSDDDLDTVRACAHIICADGGVAAVHAAGIVPDLVIGDLDSLPPAHREWLHGLDVLVEVHAPDKDDTDGELAVAAAIAAGATRIVIVGGHGGRSAMFLANLKLLRQAQSAGVEATLWGRGEQVRYLVAGDGWNWQDRAGSTMSLLPVGGDAAVRLQGTAWQGDFHLPGDRAQGVSNTIESDAASVQVRAGAVLAILET